MWSVMEFDGFGWRKNKEIKFKNMNTYQLKIQLYEDYIKELETIVNAPIGKDIEAVDRWCDWYINSEQHKWMNISDENNNICGFLIIRRDKEDCSPIKNYGIVDAYVTKENRNKGYMTKRFVDYAKEHPGIYSFTGYT